MWLWDVIEHCRSSPTGEGIFVFSSWQNEQIYQTVHRASTTIAESVRIARTTLEVRLTTLLSDWPLYRVQHKKVAA